VFVDVFTTIKVFDLNITIRHVELDKPKHGNPALMLHGVGSFADSFNYNMEHLYDLGYWPIAVDIVGFGKSDKPQQIQYTLNTFSIIMSDWIKQCQLTNILLIGTSFGAGVGLGIYDIIPEDIISIILISPAGFGKDIWVMYRIASMPLIRSLGVRLLFNSKFKFNKGSKSWSSFVYDHTSIPKEMIEYSDDYKKDHGIRYAYSQILTKFAHIFGVKKEVIQLITTIAVKVKENNIPTLIVWGKNDNIIPSRLGKVAAQLTGGSLSLIDNSGHMAHLEQFNKYNQVVETFLEGINN